MKKLIMIVALVMVIACFAGCVPAQYKEGVDVSKDYPDDNLPIYNEAIVFEYEIDDDDFIELSYGSEDDVNDVADYYNELFDENEDAFIIREIKTDDDSYYAEGIIIDDVVKFEIEVEEPRGKYEEKLFVSETKIVIEPIDKEVIDRILVKKVSYLLEVNCFDDSIYFMTNDDVVNADSYELYLDGELVDSASGFRVGVDRSKVSEYGSKFKLVALDNSGDEIVHYTIEYYDNLKEAKFNTEVASNVDADAIVLSDYTLSADDLEGLSDVNNLTKLHFDKCTFEDLSPLSKLSNVDFLQMDYCSLPSDISAIGELTKLNTITMERADVTDISSFKSLKNLTKLKLSFADSLKNISALGSLAKLANLDFSWSSEIQDFTPLAKLEKLKVLDLTSCGLDDITSLGKIVNLKDLDIGFNKNISDISVLSNLAQLRSLNISHCDKITDVSVIDSLDSLGELMVYDCFGIENISILDDYDSLTVYGLDTILVPEPEGIVIETGIKLEEFILGFNIFVDIFTELDGAYQMQKDMPDMSYDNLIIFGNDEENGFIFHEFVYGDLSVAISVDVEANVIGVIVTGENIFDSDNKINVELFQTILLAETASAVGIFGYEDGFRIDQMLNDKFIDGKSSYYELNFHMSKTEDLLTEEKKTVFVHEDYPA